MSNPLILPNICHPDFSEKGKKPVGPVEIDWVNPIARGLIVLDILDSRTFQNYAGNDGTEPGVATVGNQIQIKPLLGGQCVKFHPSGGTNGVEYVRYSGVSPDDAGDLTVISLSEVLSVDTNQHKFGWRGTSSSDDSFRLQISGGNFQVLYVDSSPSGFTSSIAASFTIGDRVFAAGTKKGATIQAHYSKNGAALTSSSPTTAGNGIFRSNTENSIQFPQYGIQGLVAGSYIFAWNRALSVSEIESVRLNPYQLLKPQNDPVYFIPAAAGVSGTASVSSVTGTTTTGSKQGSGTSSASSTSAATSQGSKDVSGTASESAITATTESGTKEASSSSSVSAVTNTASTGTSALSGDASVSAASATTETGTKDTTGTAQSTASSSTTASASKSASGVSSVSSATATTAIGTASEGFTGTASVSSATGATSTGTKAASDSASATSATGSTASATKAASSVVSVSAASSTTANGTTSEVKSGTALLSSASGSSSSGTKGATGDSSVSTVSDASTAYTTNRVGISSVSVSSSVAFQAFKAISDGLFVSSATIVSASGIKQITGESTSNITSKRIVTIVDDAVMTISVNDEAIIVNV